MGGASAGAAAPAPAAAPAVPAAPAGDGKAELSPAVRKMIADNNLDPASIPGTGKDGRITKEDVQNFLAGGSAPAVPVATAGVIAALVRFSQ